VGAQFFEPSEPDPRPSLGPGADGTGDPAHPLPDDVDLHPERLVEGPCPCVAGDELPLVLPRSRAGERVVYGTARDVQPGELGAELS